MKINADQLVYVSDEDPGILRKRRGKGFSYWFDTGRKVTGKKHLKRIRALAIPPALNNVWICKQPNGHLQATGVDSKARKQYFYHPKWVESQQEAKFNALLTFGKSLAKIRKQVQKDLKRKKWDKTKLTALAVNLLDESYMRVGNWQYTRENESYGLTTLRRKHVDVDGDKLLFTYKGKSGQQRKVRITNGRLARLVKKCSELPGYELFRYCDASDKACLLSSSDVNEYLKTISKEGFSSKDFRAWGATVLAIEMKGEAEEALKKGSRKSFKKELIKRVAEVLGNTTIVCEKYYIHPAVLEAVLDHQDKSLPAPSLTQYKKQRKYLAPEELTALLLIEQKVTGNETVSKAA